MPAIKELFEQRGQIDKQIHDIVDKAEAENRNLSDEEKQQFETLHGKDMELKERIDRSQLLAKREAEMAELRYKDVPASAAGKPRREREALTPEDRGLAIQAWIRHQSGKNLKKRHIAAVEKYQRFNRKFNLNKRYIDLPMYNDDEFRSLQHKFRTTHPQLITRDVGVGGGSAGSLIPTGFVNRLEVALLQYGPMLQVAEVMTTPSGNDMPWPTGNDTSNEGVLLSEATTVGNSVDPTFSNVTFQAYKFSSTLIKASYEITEDSAFNMEGVLGDMCGERLGRILNRKFTVGTGTSQPNGIVTAATLGVTAALSTGIAADELFDLQHSVDPAYRSGAAWMMHDSTLLAIRKLKDSQNRYLLEPGLQLGVPDRVLGSAVFINQHMDGINDAGDSTDSGEKVLIYGPLNKYKVRRVNGIRLKRLVERYADTDEEGFIAFARADGDLLDAGTHPVKYLQLA